MGNKVTIQEIAAALGLSRNTVSKALNNSGVLANATRRKILAKAREMGYGQIAMPEDEENDRATGDIREIALLSGTMLGGAHFSVSLLDAFQKKISRKGISLSMYPVRKEELKALTMPLGFRRETTVGIIVIEVFDEAYSQFLCAQNIPTLFVDTAANRTGFCLKSDVLLMENRVSTFAMTRDLIARGIRQIAFVGDRYHCQSFYERYQGFVSAMDEAGLPVRAEGSLLMDDACPYDDPDWLAERMRALKQMPRAFCCANDFIAIDVYRALKHMGQNIPSDTLVYGFDNSNESGIMEPPLTTASIPGRSMGYIAAEMLLSRIKYPDTSFRTTYIQTEVLFRRSTEG